MNRLLLAGALLIGSLAAACGGGTTTTTPTPNPGPGPQGSFTNASLNGTYAFSMSGTDNSLFGFSIARIGSFHADGQGNITMAIEDVNDGGSSAPSTSLPRRRPTIRSRPTAKARLRLATRM